MAAREARIELYKGKRGWRWRAVEVNGRTVSNCGGQQYDRRVDAMDAADKYGPKNWPVVVVQYKPRSC